MAASIFTIPGATRDELQAGLFTGYFPHIDLDSALTSKGLVELVATSIVCMDSGETYPHF